MSIKHKVIDNFLPYEEFMVLKNVFFHSSECPWYFFEDDVYQPNYLGDEKESPKFVHLIFTSDWRAEVGWLNSGPNYVYPLIRELNIISLLKIKINLIPTTKEVSTNMFHIDRPSYVDIGINYSIGIYYLNTNNGFTILEDGTKIESVENRMLIIPGNCRHTGTTSTDERRVIVNMNFINAETKSLYEQE